MTRRNATTMILAVAALLGLWTIFAGPAGAQSISSGDKASVQPIAPGKPLPPWSFPNLNGGAGGASRIDLKSVLGHRPVVLYYWMAGNQRSEEIFQEVQALVEGLGASGPILYGIAAPPPGSSDTAPIRARAQALKIRVPVLHDEGFRLAQQLNVRSVPFVAIVDKGGAVRLTNGGSLKQIVAYKMTVEDAIRRLASSGELGTYGELPRYEPITEFVGKSPPPFELPSAEDGSLKRWPSLVARDKVNVLIFWSIDCAHCTQFMPKFNSWLKAHPDGLNVVSVGKVSNETMKTKTTEFTRLNGFVFPTLFDDDFQVAQTYMVTGTPTIVIVRPDGIVDSIMPPGETNFDKFFGAKRKSILGRS